MARRNSYMLPAPEYHPLHLYKPANPNPPLHFAESTMLPPTENTLFNNTMRLPNLHSSNSGAFYGQHHYTLSASSSSQSSSYPTQHEPYRYDQNVYVNGTNTVTSKRKHPSTLSSYQNDPRYCYTGSNLLMKPVTPCLQPQLSTSIPPGYPRNNFVSVGEQHQRNVRRRLGNAPFNPSWQSSSSPSHQIYTSVNNSSSNAVAQWELQPLHGTHARLIHPTATAAGAAYPTFIMNHSAVGNSITGGNTNNHGVLFWNPNSILPNYRSSPPVGPWTSPSRYNHRQSSTYVFNDSTPSVTGSVSFSQNPRPIIRNGVLGISNGAQPSFGENELFRLASVDSAMLDVPSYLTSLDLYDEHRDLRLDIDGMSYEELLALEDRIGKVNIGLTEKQVSSCLTKTTYCSSAPEDQFESGCTICLEEYKDKDDLGMMRCLHVYHLSCINDWLRIKNACPICKAPALKDMP
ncbi:uncharacterized protein LOC110023713 [Phalaenopsis equestris]|uniref:uncharacterized protein LOC110023713 n=1 Tax=Phalaenopsis equestris TaxID=78828 RepID=UPI0009E63DF0|nr:uncharacterized protein LOC110023713 [Phalaenopsis equestris]